MPDSFFLHDDETILNYLTGSNSPFSGHFTFEGGLVSIDGTIRSGEFWLEKYTSKLLIHPGTLCVSMLRYQDEDEVTCIITEIDYTETIIPLDEISIYPNQIFGTHVFRDFINIMSIKFVVGKTTPFHGCISLGFPKIEAGDSPTLWTPAPGDIGAMWLNQVALSK